MILYIDDWKEYPKAIADVQTKNISFVRYASLLKTMGVKNYAFCLALHNPLLQGINPHDPKLSFETISMIVEEAKLNPWYIFREIIKVPASSSPDPVSLDGNRGNIALFWLFFNHVTVMLIQPRQTGKSLSTDTLMVTLFAIIATNTSINLLTKDDSLRVNNVQRIKDIMDGLPPYLKLWKPRQDTYNTNELEISRLKNFYKTGVAQASISGALKLGRGMTTPIVHIDEIAFINNIITTLPALLASTGAARDNAKAAGAPYGNVFTTTAGYLSSDSGSFVYNKLYIVAVKWSEHFYDILNEKELHDMIHKGMGRGSITDIMLLEFNHRQLGKTDEWLRGKIRDAAAEGENASADFLNKWGVGAEESPIPKDVLQRIRDSEVAEPYSEVTKFGYIIKWYVSDYEVANKFPNRLLVMGLDTSDAIGNDDISMVIRDVTTGEVIGVGIFNETNTITFSEFIADLLVTYLNMLLIIERKSTGVSILDNLLLILPMKDIDPFRRIFNWVVNDQDLHKNFKTDVIDVPFSRRDKDVYIRYRKEFGYTTTGSGRSSRDNIYGATFNASTKYTGNTVRDKVVIYQLSRLIRINGRIDHRKGEHDDSVFAWMLAYWFLVDAKHKNFYGIPIHLVLATVSARMIDEQGGLEAIIKQQKQLRIRNDIEVLVNRLKIERDPIISSGIVTKIKHLYKDIDVSGDTSITFNIDTILEKIALDKRKTYNTLSYLNR